MSDSSQQRSKFWSSFGPGLLWAGASIGVSHLVQSTRAGATAGFGLAGIILAALIVKYPFFEFGARYAAATGSSLVEGYRRIGAWALWLYLLVTLATSVIIQVAVVMFTAFIINSTLGVDGHLTSTSGLICGGAILLLWVGRFKVLDVSIKVVLVLLAVSTLLAAAVTLPTADFSTLQLLPLPDMNVVELGFLLALVGWMPTALDLAVWSSLWTLAKDRASGRRSTVKNARLDFNIGYIGTGVLAFAFLTLGAVVMHGSGESFDARGTVFSLQLLELYARSLGDWARPVVLTALITTMVSTSLTVIDGFPRAIDRSVKALSGGPEIVDHDPGKVYWVSIAVLAATTVLIVQTFLGNLTAMIDFATIVSFLTAPVLGALSLRAVSSSQVPQEHRPGPAMRILAWIGLLLLSALAIAYLVSKFGS